jgi:peroxiredoxin
VAARALTLPRIDGSAVALDELAGRERVALLFAHADCPTSVLALRRLAGARADGDGLVCVAQESPEAAARLARATGVAFTVLAEEEPYEVSRAYGVDAVPTAVVLERGEEVERVVGWDAEVYERLLGLELPGEPRSKPGCGARWTYDYAAPGGLDELEDMFERGWTDGLPVVPPTRERVEAMLAGRDGAASLGRVPPAHGEATLERVAACAVLAGCKPSYFPLVAAAVEAALEPSFNAHGIAVTTQPAGPLVVVNGPARDRAGLNSGMGVLGPGTRANMTIGRAVRLVLTLTGGAAPGGLDRSTLGNPGKLGLCFAENEEASPWEPLHVERGFAPDASTVTVIAADAPMSISDHRSRTPGELAHVFATAAAATWSPYWWPMDYRSLFVVCPEHAKLFGDAGWTKEQLRDAIFDDAVRPARELNRGETTPHVKAADPDERVHKWTDRDRILIVVAGGEAGRFSAVFGPCGGMDEAVITKEVRWNT